MDAPGSSAERIRSTPGKLGLESSRRSVYPLFAPLRPLQRLAVVQFVEAHVRVDLVHRSLPEGGHLCGHLAVAGEQGHADGVEVVGEELELVGGRAHRRALNGRATFRAEQRSRLAVTVRPPCGSLVEVTDRCVEGDDGESGPLVQHLAEGAMSCGSSGAKIVPCSLAGATSHDGPHGVTPATTW